MARFFNWLEIEYLNQINPWVGVMLLYVAAICVIYEVLKMLDQITMEESENV